MANRIPDRKRIPGQNDLFNFDEMDRDNGIVPEMDLSALPRFAKPRNDNERLLNFQSDALRGDEDAWGGMYALATTVALKFIKTAGKKNRHIKSLGAAEKKEKAHNAAAYIIAHYKECPWFFVKKNFTGYLYTAVKRELFHRRKADAIVDFVALDKLEDVAYERRF